MRVKLFCSKLFLAQIISRKTLNDHSRQSKTITIFIYKVIVKSGVALVIDTGFARYIFADMYWVWIIYFYNTWNNRTVHEICSKCSK